MATEALDAARLARFIDHTILRPEATEADVARYCREAVEHGFYSVCVNPLYAAFVAGELAGSGVATCSVVGFPFGATPDAVKAFETERAVGDGAREIDMVIAIGALRGGRHALVEADIATVKRACGPALLKVIIEACLLTDSEKVTSCRLAEQAGADFVKTSTGFSTGGATVEDVALMRRSVSPQIGVKASGGVRSLATARAMIAAGATRIGTSSGTVIMRELAEL